MPPTKQDFQNKLKEIFIKAQKIDGICGILIRAGDLHRAVGDYPGPNHRMPVCCETMKNNMGPEDKIINEPPSGQGASLTILYKIPRS